MIDPFFSKLYEKNLSTWFILPLIDLNPSEFGSANLINTYIVQSKMEVAVHVADVNLCLNVRLSPFYVETIMKEGTELLIFRIPDGWNTDFNKFLNGKYSRLSAYAKDRIRSNSGLNYQVPDQDGLKHTDAILLGLDRHPLLREKLEEMLGPLDLDEEDELLSISSPQSFIQLER